MKLDISEKKENAFLGRIEVKGALTFDGATPSHSQVTEALAAHLKVPSDLVVVKHIYTKYSCHEADVVAYAYNSVERRQRVEPLTADVKKKAGEAKKEEKKEVAT